MATPSALQTLIELATSASDEAAKRLGQALRATEKAEKKLALLHQYRDDYAKQFQAKMEQGLSSSNYRNFQAFIVKLDEAITGQQQQVQEAKGGVAVEKGAWQASERKRMSYDTLANREEKKEQHRENKKDQKLNDEHAARQGQYKQF
ncbi:MAG: flagellar export protein FliJ [Burkholderiales bacterium]